MQCKVRCLLRAKSEQLLKTEIPPCLRTHLYSGRADLSLGLGDCKTSAVSLDQEDDLMPDEPHAHLRFTQCGLSARTVAALIKSGINTPERLLSMAPDRIQLIQGIGPALMKEIEQYRVRATATG